MNQPSMSHKNIRAEKTRHEGGFTLVETSIALVVMMVMALAVVSLFIFAISYNAGANDRAIGLAIAQQRMERLRKTAFTDAALNAGTVNESYTSAGRAYSVVTIVCDTSDCGGSASSKVIRVQVSPNSSGSQWARSAATIVTRRSAPAVGQYLKP
jgi:Tfp pilus assembly protein PilV